MRVYSTAMLDEYGINETYPYTMGEYMLVLEFIARAKKKGRAQQGIYCPRVSIAGQASSAAREK
jgi:hypothetical protein